MVPGSQDLERLRDHEGNESRDKRDVSESRILLLCACQTRYRCRLFHTPCRQQPHRSTLPAPNLQTLILPCSSFSPNPSYPSSAQMPRLRDHLSPGTMSHTTKQTPETKDHRYSAPPARSSALQLAESRSAPKKQISARVKVQNDRMRILDKQAQHGIATYPVSLCNALFCVSQKLV